MQLSISDVLDAYRADLSNANRTQFSASDSTWLAFGTQLQRAASLPPAERTTYLRSGASRIATESAHDGLAKTIGSLTEDVTRDGGTPAAICAAAMFVSDDAENAGAIALATLLLDFARVLVGPDEIVLQGRMLGRQGRILRKIGELDAALERFAEVAALGETHGEQELLALAHVGKGVVARVRGNYPLARGEYLAALDSPAASDAIREHHVDAHHGLLVVSAIAKDFDAALRHGSLALAAVRSDERRVELLLNLASVCYDVGRFRASLHGYLQSLAESRIQRVRIAAFGGSAVAAARLHDAETVNALAEAAGTLLLHGRLEYELADMSREFAEAYAYLGDMERSARYQHEALDRARRRGFFEIIHRVETFVPPAPAPTTEVVLTNDALAVASQMASGDSEELLLAAVGRGQQ
jgi:tetratricopeptide (TPR) repeat protein